MNTDAEGSFKLDNPATTITDQTALVIGGTGMLRPAVHQLINCGMTVLLVSRRPGRAAPYKDGLGEFIPVEADWGKPEALVDSVLTATDGCSVSHVIVWVHSPYRTAVIRALEQVIAPDAVVINVWGSANQDPREVRLAETSELPGIDTRDVLLGYIRAAGASRWLTHAEISEGVLSTLNRTEHIHTVGQIEPWDQHP